jgi:hypothetical protein
MFCVPVDSVMVFEEYLEARAILFKGIYRIV